MMPDAIRTTEHQIIWSIRSAIMEWGYDIEFKYTTPLTAEISHPNGKENHRSNLTFDGGVVITNSLYYIVTMPEKRIQYSDYDLLTVLRNTMDRFHEPRDV